MKVEYGDTSGDDGDTALSLQSDNQEEELEEEMEEDMEEDVEEEMEDSVEDEMRGQEQQQMEKVDSVSGFLKQRKLGLPRLVRTISHDPTKIKAGAMVLMMVFVSGNDSIKCITSTTASRRYLFCAEFSPFPRPDRRWWCLGTQRPLQGVRGECGDWLEQAAPRPRPGSLLPLGAAAAGGG